MTSIRILVFDAGCMEDVPCSYLTTIAIFRNGSRTTNLDPGLFEA
jgi:hypothetical protein